MLALVPAAAILHAAVPQARTAVFVTSALAIVPLAAWLGRATGELAARTTESLGGLLNATFGNASELIIGIVALRDGLQPIVKASLTGSILGNLLLVMGGAIAAGGTRHRVQRFNPAGARVRSTMLMMAAIALIVPAAYHYVTPAARGREHAMSAAISVLLLVTYSLGLLFSLRTHRQFFVSPGGGEPRRTAAWSARRALAVLAGATALIAWMSEILMASVEAAAHALGMSDLFVGVIVIAIVGNAAEHATAVAMALENRMELALGIAVSSSIQVALFVAPVLALLSYAIAPAPMDLAFTPAEVLAVGLAVLIVAHIAGDGESNWLEGVQLLAVYAIFGIAFYFLPAAP